MFHNGAMVVVDPQNDDDSEAVLHKGSLFKVVGYIDSAVMPAVKVVDVNNKRFTFREQDLRLSILDN